MNEQGFGTQKQLSIKQSPSTNKYKKVNAYSHQASFEQILTIILFTTQFTIHCVFIIRPIFGIDNGLLYFLWGILLLMISVVIVDYFILTCGDPGDKLLISPQEIDGWKIMQMKFEKRNSLEHKQSQKRDFGHQKILNNPYQVKMCKTCRRAVKKISYHCWTCNRCVENLDHHCKYLNNCIGQRNYNSFFRMLCCVSLYLIISIAIGLWIFVVGLNDSNIDSLTFSKWLGLVFSLLSLGLFIVVQTLLWFHCYISCYLKMTTIQYLFRDTPSNNTSESSISKSKKIKTNK